MIRSLCWSPLGDSTTSWSSWWELIFFGKNERKKKNWWGQKKCWNSTMPFRQVFIRIVVVIRVDKREGKKSFPFPFSTKVTPGLSLGPLSLSLALSSSGFTFHSGRFFFVFLLPFRWSYAIVKKSSWVRDFYYIFLLCLCWYLTQKKMSKLKTRLKSKPREGEPIHFGSFSFRFFSR